MRHRNPDEYGSGANPPWRDIDWPGYRRTLTVAGREVNLVDVGEGPAIVFVHGHSACWQHWLEQITAFTDTHRCVALDLPGFGRSEMPDGGVSIRSQARALDDVLTQLGISAACVVGSSMGGFVGAELAISYPHRVERLVLVAAAGVASGYVGIPTELIRNPGVTALARVVFGLGGVPRRPGQALAVRPRGRRLAMQWLVAYPEALHPALVYELMLGAGGRGAAEAFLELATYDFRDRVSEIACPTMIVWGDRDRVVPPRCADRYAELIPHARVEIYDDTGHLPMLERPRRFNADLADFLADVDAPDQDARRPAVAA